MGLVPNVVSEEQPEKKYSNVVAPDKFIDPNVTRAVHPLHIFAGFVICDVALNPGMVVMAVQPINMYDVLVTLVVVILGYTLAFVYANMYDIFVTEPVLYVGISHSE